MKLNKLIYIDVLLQQKKLNKILITLKFINYWAIMFSSSS